jgi:hypothetical protein
MYASFALRRFDMASEWLSNTSPAEKFHKPPATCRMESSKVSDRPPFLHPAPAEGRSPGRESALVPSKGSPLYSCRARVLAVACNLSVSANESLNRIAPAHSSNILTCCSCLYPAPIVDP